MAGRKKSRRRAEFNREVQEWRRTHKPRSEKGVREIPGRVQQEVFDPMIHNRKGRCGIEYKTTDNARWWSRTEGRYNCQGWNGNGAEGCLVMQLRAMGRDGMIYIPGVGEAEVKGGSARVICCGEALDGMGTGNRQRRR